MFAAKMMAVDKVDDGTIKRDGMIMTALFYDGWVELGREGKRRDREMVGEYENALLHLFLLRYLLTKHMNEFPILVSFLFFPFHVYLNGLSVPILKNA